MGFLLENWQYVTMGILIADKIVAVTPTKYDDMLLTGVKAVIKVLSGQKR